MHSLRFTFIILLVLLIPFILRLKNEIFEPYPAILLPEGASSIKNENNTVSVSMPEISGLDKKNRWKVIDPFLFMGPIPDRYFYFYAQNGFDVMAFKNKRFKIAKYFNRIPPEIDSNAINQRNLWIKTQLSRQGFNPSIIKITNKIKVIYLPTHKIVNEYSVNEKFLYFN